MHEGELVVVTGKLDQRIRDAAEGLVTGTICCTASKEKIWVLLPDGNLWIGHPREVAPIREQMPTEAEGEDGDEGEEDFEDEPTDQE